MAKAAKLEEALGPEFVALVSSLKGVDPNSQDAREISSILDPLDELWNGLKASNGFIEACDLGYPFLSFAKVRAALSVFS